MKKKQFILCLFVLSLIVFSTPTHSFSQKESKVHRTVSNKDKYALFYKKLKKAVAAKDKAAVAKMVRYPFVDGYNEVYDKKHALTCKSAQEFLDNYDLIFDSTAVSAVMNNKYRTYRDNPYKGDVIDRYDYLLTVQNPGRSKDIIFKFIKGNYYIAGIPYYQ